MIFILYKRAYATSYYWLIASEALSLTVFENSAIGWNFALEIAAKPLQMETWLLLTIHKKSPLPYPTAPLPTPYNLPFSHNSIVTFQDHPRLSKVNDFRVIWKAPCNFLLMINSNLGLTVSKIKRLIGWNLALKLRLNRCRWKHGYYWQSIGSRHCSI